MTNTKDVNAWIPIRESMPKIKNTTFGSINLSTRQSDDVFVNVYKAFDDISGYMIVAYLTKGNKWLDKNGKIINKNGYEVTHWMPIPKLPRNPITYTHQDYIDSQCFFNDNYDLLMTLFNEKETKCLSTNELCANYKKTTGKVISKRFVEAKIRDIAKYDIIGSKTDFSIIGKRTYHEKGKITREEWMFDHTAYMITQSSDYIS